MSWPARAPFAGDGSLSAVRRGDAVNDARGRFDSAIYIRAALFLGSIYIKASQRAAPLYRRLTLAFSSLLQVGSMPRALNSGAFTASICK